MSRRTAILGAAALLLLAAISGAFFIGLADHEPDVALEDELVRACEECDLYTARRKLAGQELELSRNLIDLQQLRGKDLVALIESDPGDAKYREELDAVAADIKRIEAEIPAKERELVLLDEAIAKSRDIVILLCAKAELDWAAVKQITSGGVDSGKIRELLAAKKAREK
ncbi:MAG: hypothetical protein WC712_01460 [Candidatus Brocadiia bacterium]